MLIAFSRSSMYFIVVSRPGPLSSGLGGGGTSCAMAQLIDASASIEIKSAFISVPPPRLSQRRRDCPHGIGLGLPGFGLLDVKHRADIRIGWQRDIRGRAPWRL